MACAHQTSPSPQHTKCMKNLLESIGATREFRDPIHGFIKLTEYERKIIDTKIFQRLRRIHQLALTKYVYHGAEHSRFIHSIGALHTASMIYINIAMKASDWLTEDEQLTHFKILRFAALLHDIGHLPFSHAAEENWLEFPTETSIHHEDISAYIIEKHPEIREIIESSSVNPAQVASIIKGNTRPNLRTVKNIISGNLDADRADYLLRDSHFCGVRYGGYDFERYAASFRLNYSSSSSQIIVNEKDIYILESFILARHHYSMQVVYHKTRTAYDIVLKKFLKSIDRSDSLRGFISFDTKHSANQFEIDFVEFEDLDDYKIFERIKEESRENEWAKYLMRQKHLRLVYEATFPLYPSTSELGQSNGQSINRIPRHCNDGKERFTQLLVLLGKSSLNENEDYFIIKDDINIHKFTPGSDEKVNRQNHDVLIHLDHEDKQIPVSDASIMISTMPPKIKLMRIYSTPEKFDEVDRICKKG